MDPVAGAVVAMVVWLLVCFGYVLLAGMGLFWAVVWPRGHAEGRLRWVAAAGLGLLSLGTVAEGLVDLLGPYAGEAPAEHARAWLLVRLAALAVAGCAGPALLRRPVEGGRRVLVLGVITVLTVSVVADSMAPASARGLVMAGVTGAYVLALAAWLGSLIALAALLVPRDRPAGLGPLWTRFSWLAATSVLLLIGSGTAQHLVVGGTATSRSGVLLLIEVPVVLGTWALSRYAVAYGRRVSFRERFLPGWRAESRGQAARLGRAVGLQLGLSVALLGLAVTQLVVLPVPGRPSAPILGDAVPTVPVAAAREGRVADSDEPRFVPERIELSGGASADVVPVATRDRELVVPEDVGRVGWWDGSSYVGDPFGSTVIAGHIDVYDRGLGFFFRLWNIEVGERVVLSAGDRRQAYAITERRELPRTDLVDDEEVYAADGPPRLVLITCAGEFDPERGGYRRNLVVVARPVS